MIRLAAASTMVILLSGSIVAQETTFAMDSPENTIQSLWSAQLRRDTTIERSSLPTDILFSTHAMQVLTDRSTAYSNEMKASGFRKKNLITSVRRSGPHAIVETKEYHALRDTGRILRYELEHEFGLWKIDTCTEKCKYCDVGKEPITGKPCTFCDGVGWTDALDQLSVQ